LPEFKIFPVFSNKLVLIMSRSLWENTCCSD